MASLLLDTSVLAGIERRRLSLTEFVTEADEAAVAAISIAELLVAVQLSQGRRRTIRSRFVGGVLADFPVVPYTTNVAVSHARLMSATRTIGRPRGTHDLIIAATAQATDRIVVTTDHGFADLPGVEVRLI